MLDNFLINHPLQQILLLSFVALVAGTARGFSGFGGGLIFVPLASALASPQVAAPVLLIVDAVMTVGMLPDAIRRANRREVGMVAIGALVGVPTGTVLLAYAPSLFLRWCIAAIVLGLLAFLISGWRYQGKPKTGLSIGTGLIAGLFGGVAQLSGPPVVAYWLGGAIPAARVRANLVAYFALSTIITTVSYVSAGLLTLDAVLVSCVAGPGYGLGILLGSRLFGLADEKTFRRICLALIGAAGVISLPVLDSILR
jgi:hypothetical protein